MRGSNVFKTLKDIHPEEIYVTSEQYKAIKHRKSHKPFVIKNKKVANALIICSLIEEDEIIINEDEVDENGDYVLPRHAYTGKYLLTPEGEYYLDYRQNENKAHFATEFRAWLTLAITLAGLVLSIYSIYLNQLSNIK